MNKALWFYLKNIFINPIAAAQGIIVERKTYGGLLSVFSEGNKWAFILSTFFLGLAYGWIAYKTGSARWTAISRSIDGILVLSGTLATSVLKLHFLIPNETE